MGGSPICVMAEKSSKLITLHVAPVSSWHATVVVKFSSADLKKSISANHCLAFASTSDMVSNLKQLSSERYTSMSST